MLGVYTSVRVRIRRCQEGKPGGKRRGKRGKKQGAVPELLEVKEFSSGVLTDRKYLKLVDETGRLVRAGKGKIPPHLSPILERLKLKPDAWLTMQTKKRQLFRRAIGPVESLHKLALQMGKRWLHGLRSAELVFE